MKECSHRKGNILPPSCRGFTKLQLTIMSEHVKNTVKGGTKMFENLKDVLGEAYHEDITAEEINTFFSGKKFADLSTGMYVDKNKYEKEINNLNTVIKEKDDVLNSKLSDEEKKDKTYKDQSAEIERLTKLLKENTISGNKNLALGKLANAKTILSLKDDDTNYNEFINNIVSDDNEKTNSIASYAAKLINDAYEKGKKDAIKDKLGKFGNSKKSSTSEEPENIGAKLAKRSNGNKETVDFFARNK